MMSPNKAGKKRHVEIPFDCGRHVEIDRYMRELKAFDSGLTPERHLELAKIIAEPKNIEEFDAAVDEMTVANLSLVIHLVAKFVNRNGRGGLSVSDLIQEGNIALHKAVRTYDYRKGCTLATYAWKIISRKIEMADRQFRFIRAPENYHEIIREIRNLDEKLAQKMGRRINSEECYTIEDYAQKTGRTKASIAAVLNHFRVHVSSANVPLLTSEEDSDTEVIDMLVDEKANIFEDIKETKILEAIFDSCRKLGGKVGGAILCKAFSDPDTTLDFIAAGDDVSRERVRQRLLTGVRRLSQDKELAKALERQAVTPMETGKRKYTKCLRQNKPFGPPFADTMDIAKEIVQLITKGEGLTLDEYVSRAEAITVNDLGYRKSKALAEDPAMCVFIPDEVISVFREKDLTSPRFNKSDDDYLRKHQHKPTVWLAKRFYTNTSPIRQRMENIGLSPTSSIHKYSEEEEAIIRKYVARGSSGFLKNLIYLPRESE